MQQTAFANEATRRAFAALVDNEPIADRIATQVREYGRCAEDHTGLYLLDTGWLAEKFPFDPWNGGLPAVAASISLADVAWPEVTRALDERFGRRRDARPSRIGLTGFAKALAEADLGCATGERDETNLALALDEFVKRHHSSAATRERAKEAYRATYRRLAHSERLSRRAASLDLDDPERARLMDEAFRLGGPRLGVVPMFGGGCAFCGDFRSADRNGHLDPADVLEHALGWTHLAEYAAAETQAARNRKEQRRHVSTIASVRIVRDESAGVPLPSLAIATFDDGTVRTVFSFDPTKMDIAPAELVGLTETQAIELRSRRERARP